MTARPHFQALRLFTLALLLGSVIANGALACSIPVGFDPNCKSGETFSTISCRCEPSAAPMHERKLVLPQQNKVQAAPDSVLPAAMTACTDGAHCRIISGVCGKATAVSAWSIAEAERYIADINRRIECQRNPAPADPPQALCVVGACQASYPIMAR